jgi:hypothetical protein
MNITPGGDPYDPRRKELVFQEIRCHIRDKEASGDGGGPSGGTLKIMIEEAKMKP